MPTSATVHNDAMLTNVSVGYKPNDFVASILFPHVTVEKQSDKYYTIDALREGLRQQDDARAPGAESKSADYEVGTDTYFCNGHALHRLIPDEVRANADTVLQEDIAATEFLSDKILLNKEIALVSALETGLAAAGTTLLTLTNEWDDPINGDPIGDIETARGYVITGSQGRVPNTLIIPWATYRGMRNHPDILDRFKGGATTGSSAILTETLLAQLFDVERIVIPKCFKNTAAHGATAVIAPVWGEDDVILAYVAPNVGRNMQTLGVTFAWDVDGVGVQGYMVEKYRHADNDRKSDVIRASFYYDQEIIDSGCACRIANTVT